MRCTLRYFQGAVPLPAPARRAADRLRPQEPPQQRSRAHQIALLLAGMTRLSSTAVRHEKDQIQTENLDASLSIDETAGYRPATPRTIPTEEPRMRSELTWVAVAARATPQALGYSFLSKRPAENHRECLALPWPSFRRRALLSITPLLGVRL
jgi:hypothetical protein